MRRVVLGEGVVEQGTGQDLFKGAEKEMSDMTLCFR